MADIFISHSGKDNEVAATIGERIAQDRPTWSLFYDKDNIRAGQRWQERLREELTSCRVVLALLSRNWLDSQWCFTEAVTAGFDGKDVVGIETEDLTNDELARAPPILHERQRVRLRGGDDRPWQEILEALDRSGLDPDNWFPIPPNVGPYPGLVAFDEKDAGVFFGRKQEITEYLGILDTLRGPDRAQVLVISGGSGSGKSSLLRAGLISRLRRKKFEWVVVSAFEVAREPVRNLLDQLGNMLADHGIPTHGLDLKSAPDDPGTLARVLDETLRRLEQATGAWVLLPLDQAEALVAGDNPASAPARVLLDGLAEVLGRRTRHLVVAATIRTEFVPRLETVFTGTAVRLLQAPLSAVNSLAEVIEKPAERFGLVLEPGLTERIIEDVRTADALPLLAYLLKALNDRAAADKRLTLDSYRTLNGVQGAIAAKLELVLSDPEPTAEEARALQRGFTRYLIRVDEGAVEGDRLLRRVAPRASLPRAADRIIDRLVGAGVLVTKNGTIELAHERLIDNWPKLPLKMWLAQDATDRRLIDQLHQRESDDALPDGLLAQSEELIQRDHELTLEEPGILALVQRSRDERGARERRRRLFLGVAVMVALLFAVVAGLALWQWKAATNQKQLADTAKQQADTERDKARIQLLAMQARKADTEAKSSADDIERAGALALESLRLARESNRPAEADAIAVARSALIRLPLRTLTQGSSARSMAALPDGRLASGGDDGTINIWPTDGVGEPVILQHGSPVLSLAALPDGRLASGGGDGTIKLWPREGNGEPVVLSQGSRVLSLAALPDGRLAGGSDDGMIRLWPKDSAGGPKFLRHGSGVYTLAVLADGRLASGGYDGKVKAWPKQEGGEPEVLSNTNTIIVSSLAALPDGRVASAGFADSNIKLWPKEGKGEPVVLSQGRLVLSLTVLPDGRLASGDDGGNIKLWPKDGAGEPKVLLHGGLVSSLAVLPDGRLASGGWDDGKIRLWPKDGKGEPVVLSHGGLVSSLAVLPDGRLASGGFADSNIKLWPKEFKGEPVVLSQGEQVWSLTVLPDGRLASGDKSGTIKLWPKSGAGKPAIFSQGSGWVRSLTALPDGRVVSGSDDGNDKGKIRLWPKDGVGEPVVLSSGSSVWSLTVLPDGRLASGGGDGTIKLWPKEGKGEPVVLSQGSTVVRSLAVLPDGRLASSGEDGTIKLWPKEGAGEPVVIAEHGRFFGLAVLPDGLLASAGDDGKIKLWIVDEQKLIAALCLRPGRNLSKEEWARYIGSDVPQQPSCGALGFPSNWRTPDP